MNYFQLLKLCLNFAIATPLSESFIEYWCSKDRKTIPTHQELIADFKMKLSYIKLLVFNKYTALSSEHKELLNKLENYFTEWVPMISNIPFEELRKIDETLMEDQTLIEELCSCTDAEELDERFEEIYHQRYDQELINKAYEYGTIMTSAIGNVFYDAITLLPEVFFTKEGQKFIPEEYRMTDEALMSKCLKYTRDAIYCFYDYYIKKDLTVDNTEIFFYAVRITNIVAELIRTKKFAYLEKMIELDDKLYFIKEETESIVNKIYDPGSVKSIELLDTAFITLENEKLLNFFLGNDSSISSLNSYQLAIVIACYKRELQIDEIKTGISNSKEILYNNDLKIDEKIALLKKEKGFNHF